MAHPEQKHFVAQCRRFLAPWFIGRQVLEIGSLDINGSVREFFSGCQYLGIDIGPGRGVDLVVGGDRFRGPDAGYDTIVSCECLEHDPHWQDTFRNALRMLRPDGIMIVTCAHLGRRQHGTSKTTPRDSPHTAHADLPDYYRNLGETDFRALGDLDRWFCWHRFFIDYAVRDIYFLGLGKDLAAHTDAADRLAADLERHLSARNVAGEW